MKLRKALKEDFLEFCSNAGIHGIANITDHRNSMFSRILWLAVVTTFFVLSGICIHDSINGKSIYIRGYIYRLIAIIK